MKRKLERKRISKFEKTFILVVILTLFIFALGFFLQMFLNITLILDIVLRAAGLAAFAGLLFQYILSYIQEQQAKKVYKIKMICIEGSFSTLIANGIKESFSQIHDVNFELVSIKINESADVNNIENQLIDSIEKMSLLSDGLIIRPLEGISECLFLCLQKAIKRVKVVLVDFNLDKNQKARLGKTDYYGFVCSDSNHGGQLIAEAINYLSSRLSDYSVILLTGPRSHLNLNQRSEVIINHIADSIPYENFSLNVKETKNIVEIARKQLHDSLSSVQYDVRDKKIIIFCGIDIIARGFMELTAMGDKFFNSAKDTIFIGYDGLKDFDNRYIMQFLNYKYITIDVILDEQGHTTADIMYLLLTEKSIKVNEEYLIKPVLKSNILNCATNEEGIFFFY